MTEKINPIPYYCIAYAEDGTICGKPAIVIDVQRGGMVCEEHALRRDDAETNNKQETVPSYP